MREQILLGSAVYSDNFCGNYKTISLTPMRLSKTHFFEKKATIPVKKC